jgi:hypothetical protein
MGWQTTFTKEAAKVVNKELEKTIEPLSLRIEELEQELAQKEQELTVKNQELEHYRHLDLPLTDDQLFIGAKVKIIGCTQGWNGYTGVVDGRFSYGDWWIKVDGSESKTRQLYKASQLTWNRETLKTNETEPLASNQDVNRLELGKTRKIQDLISVFNRIARNQGLSAWSSQGYCDRTGKVHRNFVDGLYALVMDLTVNSHQMPELTLAVS